MARQPRGPRKRRTREHVIADLSVLHVERFILEAGYTAQRLGSDYGYDMAVWSFDEEGYAEPGLIYIQFKAMEALADGGAEYVYDLDVRDVNLWTEEKSPVILILYDATRRIAYWLGIQGYFEADPARHPKRNAKTVRVRVPKRHRVNRRAIVQMRDLKRTIYPK